MREEFFPHKLRPATLEIIRQANCIIGEYESQGITLSLRQLYYQFVARDKIENSQKAYNSLGEAIRKGREAGLVDWAAIEDRARSFNSYSFEENENEVLLGIEFEIRFDYWARQKSYIECWVEKDALVNVIERPCRELGVPYMACKGYLSASHAYNAGKRLKKPGQRGNIASCCTLATMTPRGST